MPRPLFGDPRRRALATNYIAAASPAKDVHYKHGHGLLRKSKRREHPNGVARGQDSFFCSPERSPNHLPFRGAVNSIGTERNGRISCRGETYARGSQAPYRYAARDPDAHSVVDRSPALLDFMPFLQCLGDRRSAG